MAAIAELRARLEGLLSELSDVDIQRTPEGDYPFRWGSASCFVTLVDDDPALVSVFGGMLSGVPRTDKLCSALNDINAEIKFGRVFWVRDRVVVATEMVADDLDGSELENAVTAIGRVADAYDTDLQSRFGGQLSFRS